MQHVILLSFGWVCTFQEHQSAKSTSLLFPTFQLPTQARNPGDNTLESPAKNWAREQG